MKRLLVPVLLITLCSCAGLRWFAGGGHLRQESNFDDPRSALAFDSEGPFIFAGLSGELTPPSPAREPLIGLRLPEPVDQTPEPASTRSEGGGFDFDSPLAYVLYSALVAGAAGAAKLTSRGDGGE